MATKKIKNANRRTLVKARLEKKQSVARIAKDMGISKSAVYAHARAIRDEQPALSIARSPVGDALSHADEINLAILKAKESVQQHIDAGANRRHEIAGERKALQEKLLSLNEEDEAIHTAMGEAAGRFA